MIGVDDLLDHRQRVRKGPSLSYPQSRLHIDYASPRDLHVGYVGAHSIQSDIIRPQQIFETVEGSEDRLQNLYAVAAVDAAGGAKELKIIAFPSLRLSSNDFSTASRRWVVLMRSSISGQRSQESSLRASSSGKNEKPQTQVYVHVKIMREVLPSSSSM